MPKEPETQMRDLLGPAEASTRRQHPPPQATLYLLKTYFLHSASPSISSRQRKAAQFTCGFAGGSGRGGVGVGNSNLGGVGTRARLLRGSAGCILLVEESKADGPATFLPPNRSLFSAPPSAASSSCGEQEGGGGRVELSHAEVRTPKASGVGGRRACG